MDNFMGKGAISFVGGRTKCFICAATNYHGFFRTHPFKPETTWPDALLFITQSGILRDKPNETLRGRLECATRFKRLV